MVEYHDNVTSDFPLYLNDESGIVKNGFAERIYFPKSIDEISEVVNVARNENKQLSISGGGTGLSGGRVPLEGWIIATDKMRNITVENSTSWKDPETGINYELKLESVDADHAQLTLPISMTIKSIQNYCREVNWFYPPDPTERSCFIGGNVATNASGSRTFKYGPTRNWLQSIIVVLPDGCIIDLDRNIPSGSITKNEIIIETKNKTYRLPRPNLPIPNVSKHVATPVITNNSHPMDLFIGTGGLFAIVSEVTIKLIRPPKNILNIFVYCSTKDQLVHFIRVCQANRREQKFPIPMSLEMLDDRALTIMRRRDSSISSNAKFLIILEQDSKDDTELERCLEYWMNLFDNLGIEDTRVAQTYSEIEKHKGLRHSVPEQVNAIVRRNGEAKLGTDCSVPEEDFETLLDKLVEKGEEFEMQQNKITPLNDQIGYALWGHAGDCHMHLNLIPRNSEETKFAKQLFIDILEFCSQNDGSIASEHGLGKKVFGGKPALWYQYGQEGIDQIKKLKVAIDPMNLLNSANLIFDIN